MSKGIDQGILSNNLGYQALKKGQLNQAIVLLKQSVEYCKSVGDWEGEITALNNLAEALFKKWASQTSPRPDLHESISNGFLADGIQCLARDLQLSIEHQDLKGAGITLQQLTSALEQHGGLSEDEAMNIYAHFVKDHAIPILTKNNIWEIPGEFGFPILRLEKKPP